MLFLLPLSYSRNNSLLETTLLYSRVLVKYSTRVEYSLESTSNNQLEPAQIRDSMYESTSNRVT